MQSTKKKAMNVRKPKWLKSFFPTGKKYLQLKDIVKKENLHTICESGMCPNRGECWSSGTATFMILGNICTRNCKFCNVTTGKPLEVDKAEPNRVAKSVQLMDLNHCVITSVDRDDLEDRGAKTWAKTIRQIKKINPETSIETLIPDFDAKEELLDLVIAEDPDVVSHNLETVERLTNSIRTKATYQKSLKVLKYLKEKGMLTKSGIMLGLGETREEILATMDSLRSVDCDIFTLGQYLRPAKENIEVQQYVTPETFEEYKQIALDKGFKFVESSPLVRTSYKSQEHLESLKC